MRDAGGDQRRPASSAAADINADAAVHGQKTPRKNAEIVLENLPPLLLRKVIVVLAERRPFLAEALRNLGINVIVHMERPEAP